MSAARAIYKALTHVRAAITSYKHDSTRVLPDLKNAERILEEEYNRFTPVDPPADSDMQKSLESSSKFKASDALRHLEHGKAAVARIEENKKRVSRPPKSR